MSVDVIPAPVEAWVAYKTLRVKISHLTYFGGKYIDLERINGVRRFDGFSKILNARGNDQKNGVRKFCNLTYFRMATTCA